METSVLEPARGLDLHGHSTRGFLRTAVWIPKNSDGEALTPSVMVFGDRTFREIIKALG